MLWVCLEVPEGSGVVLSAFDVTSSEIYFMQQAGVMNNLNKLKKEKISYINQSKDIA